MFNGRSGVRTPVEDGLVAQCYDAHVNATDTEPESDGDSNSAEAARYLDAEAAVERLHDEPESDDNTPGPPGGLDALASGSAVHVANNGRPGVRRGVILDYSVGAKGDLLYEVEYSSGEPGYEDDIEPARVVLSHLFYAAAARPL